MPEDYTHMSTMVRISKRLLDIILAMIGIIFSLPLLPFIILAIKLDSRGSIFFTQERIGEMSPQKVTHFHMIKFRTMVCDAEKNGAQWATKQDSRITRVGMFLRKTRLDEIPQFINVIRGEMSFIGPRPERPEFYDKLEDNISFYSERTYGVKPGITGLAQVYQGYDETIEDVRNKVGFDHAYALSLGTLRRWLLMDMLIIWKTISVVVCGRGQ